MRLTKINLLNNKWDSSEVEALVTSVFIVSGSSICFKNNQQYCLESFSSKDINFLRTSFECGDNYLIIDKYLYGFPLPFRKKNRH
jgi:hypothetical protein